MVQSLIREGVEVVFGIPGIHMSGIVAALRDEPSIRMVTTRSEQAALAHMADGPARSGTARWSWRLVVPGTGVYVELTIVPRGFLRQRRFCRPWSQCFGGRADHVLGDGSGSPMSPLGTTGMRAGELDLDALLSQGKRLEVLDGPVVIDVPSAGMELPRPKMIAHIATCPVDLAAGRADHVLRR